MKLIEQVKSYYNEILYKTKKRREFMNEIKEHTEKMFEDIKHIDEEGKEYWLARELQVAFEYKRWDKFCKVIENAKITCEKSKYAV